MMNDNFKNDYIRWLYKNIDECKVQENVYRITLPYLDRNNDCIEIFIKIKGDHYVLTDDGEILDELELSNFNLFSSKKRAQIFDRILLSHGVKKSANNELYVECYSEELPQKKHMLSQCMVKISDMFFTSKSAIQSLFLEDVQLFLDERDIRYTPNVSFSGKSGLNTNYDFVIPKSKVAPERIIKVVNNIDQTIANSILFLWDDTQQERDGSSMLYVFLQDNEKRIPLSTITAMENYNVVPVKWSMRDKYTNDLVK